jgi:hypothetical protein
MSPITFGPTPLRRARRPPTTSSACVTSHLENCRASTSILFLRSASAGSENFKFERTIEKYSKLQRANGGCLGAKNR